MTTSEALRRYWRIAVIAVLGAVLAFGSSFLVAPTYQSSTRLLIHGQEATFLSSSGQSRPAQAGIIDSTQAKALADTYGSIATSRSVAEAVVDELRLDQPDGDSGLLHAVSSTVAWVYRCGRAFLTAGFCASVDRREAAIGEVQQGTTALQLGTTAGSTAGQPGSYVLEITASGESGEEARAVTEAVADQLVTASADLVQNSAEDYIERLQAEVDEARAAVDTAAAAVADFQVRNDVSEADQQLVGAATSYDSLRSELNTARADLADAEAQLSSIEESLRTTPPTVASDQQIDTGRSGTSITTSQVNPVHSDLQARRSETEARITGLRARIPVLEQQVASGSPIALSGTLAELAKLQDDLTAAQQSRDTLTAELAAVRTEAATAAPDLTRLDAADRPAYPVSPRRYLYLVIGLLLGGLAGGGLTWLAERRRTPDPGTPSDGAPDDSAPTTDALRILGLDGQARQEHDGAEPDRHPVAAVDAERATATEQVGDGDEPVPVARRTGHGT